jgi:hypothetical protein
MKKSIMLFVFAGMVLFSLAFVKGAGPLTNCAPSVELINQDPYPANPGEYVRVVFQISGLENPDCKKVTLTLKEDFPFSLEPGATSSFEVAGKTYVRNFNSTALVPYKLLVDNDAVDGDNQIEALLQYEDAGGESIVQVEQFNINVNGVGVDFDISVDDFDSTTDTLTFAILNVGEDDVQALTVGIPKQDNIVVKGNNLNIIGGLDAKDDTTFNYEAVPKDGEIELAISYTDSIDERREMMKKVYYDSSYFTDRKANAVQPKSAYYYLFWVLILILIVLWVRKWLKKRKERKKK